MGGEEERKVKYCKSLYLLELLWIYAKVRIMDISTVRYPQ